MARVYADSATFRRRGRKRTGGLSIEMAGRNDEKLGTTVNKVWSFLDQLSESNPEEYRRFIKKAMEERREFLEPPHPVFCFSTGIRGKEHYKLYVNACKWHRVPEPKTRDDPIPVKGGLLRHLVHDGKKCPQDLLIDIAFNPLIIETWVKDREMKEILIDLILDFLDDYLLIVTDRNVQVLLEDFKGPLDDIGNSLDGESTGRVSRESQLDMEESILSSLKRGKAKTKRKGTSSLPPLFPQQQGPQTSRHDNTKLIEEMSQTQAKVRPSKNHRITSEIQEGGGEEKVESKSERSPEYTLEVCQKRGENVVCVTVQLAGVGSVEDVELDVSKNDLHLLVPGVYQLSLPLPLSVDNNSTTARFSRRSRSLIITIPISTPD